MGSGGLLPEPWMRWYDLPVLRRLARIRWSLGKKHWHPQRRRLARLRCLYWTQLRGHDSEMCARCGGPVRVVYFAPDDLWERYSGFAGAARTPDGEAGCGVLCPLCFDALYREAGAGFLRWTCGTNDRIIPQWVARSSAADVPGQDER